MPDAHGDHDTYRQHLEWTARKRTGLRRRTLDCGHPNPGEVFYHAWCDRLSCSSECAEAVHDCSKYAGVKSSSEKGSGQPEAVVEPPVPWVQCDTSPWVSFETSTLTTLPAGRTHIAVTTAYDPHDRVAEAFRAVVREQGLAPCEIQIDGRTEWLAAASDPMGDLAALYRRMAADTTYRPDPPPVLTRQSAEIYNREMARLREPSAPPVDAASEPGPGEPQVFMLPPTLGVILEFGGGFYRYACPHSGCAWAMVARFRPHLVDLVEAHDLEQHTRTSWWSRLLPGRRTR